MDSVQCLVILSPRAPDMLWDESLSGSTRPLKYTGKKWLCYVQVHMSCAFLTVYAGVLQSICPIVRSLNVLQHKFLYQLKLSCQTFKTLFQFLTHQHLLKRTKVSKNKKENKSTFFFLIMEKHIISQNIKCSLSWINHQITSKYGECLLCSRECEKDLLTYGDKDNCGPYPCWSLHSSLEMCVYVYH